MVRAALEAYAVDRRDKGRVSRAKVVIFPTLGLVYKGETPDGKAIIEEISPEEIEERFFELTGGLLRSDLHDPEKAASLPGGLHAELRTRSLGQGVALEMAVGILGPIFMIV